MVTQECLEKGLTPALNLSEERPYCSEDYVQHQPTSLQILVNIQPEKIQDEHLGIKRKFIYFC